MKWFKHDTDASVDAKLQELLFDYGAEGYGLYWYCIELISANVTPKNITFELEHDSRVIARNLNLSIEKTKHMMQKMIDLKLFDISKNEKLRCIKIADRLDEFTRKSVNTNKILSAVSVENQKCVRSVSGVSRILSHTDKDIDIDKDIEDCKKSYSIESKIQSKLSEYKNINISAFYEWITYKKFKSIAPVTKTLNFLSSYDLNTQQIIVDTSIMNQYKGLFPPKQNTQQYNTPKSQTLNTDVNVWDEIEKRGVQNEPVQKIVN